MELKVLSRIGTAVGLDCRMLLVHSSLILMIYDGNVNQIDELALCRVVARIRERANEKKKK